MDNQEILTLRIWGWYDIHKVLPYFREIISMLWTRDSQIAIIHSLTYKNIQVKNFNNNSEKNKICQKYKSAVA